MDTHAGISLLFAVVAAAAGCTGSCASTEPVVDHTPMSITSPAFGDSETIDARFTCDGEDVSPQLDVAGVPDSAEALAIIVDDPDAPRGTWVHWVYFDLPKETRQIPENAGAPVPSTTETASRQGRNDFSNLGYGGPCPPPGDAHRYFFKLYALDAQLGLPEGATREDVVRAMQDHVLSEAQLVGRYSRPSAD